MLSQESNEFLCRVGRGTVMGDAMRQYWIPALLSAELPEPDCAPVRTLLLGERLIAFRDSAGRVGLLQSNCPHRGAALFYARNEEGGLRCVYHGWKFDTGGRCLDMPSEPPESNFKDKIRARSYPCVERGGLVWAYMGSRAVPPPLPDLEPTTLPEDELHITATLRACNWVQALEGDIDTAHFSFLHFGSLRPAQAPPGSFLRMTVTDRAPRYQVIDTAWGVMYGAYRPAGEGGTYWRIGQFLFPFWTMVPVPVLGEKCGARAWVPLDDTHTMFYGLSPKRPAGAPAPPSDVTLESLQLPNSTDWYGRFRLEQDASNDYHIDRAMQRGNGSYTGIDGISTQDQAVTESMGPLMDRTAEHLGTSDAMVIRVRRRLLTAARAFRASGLVPPGVDEPAVYRQRSGGVILREGADWIAETEDLRQAYIVRSELDRSLMTGT